VHQVRQEAERRERTLRTHLKIKKRKKYDDGYEEPNRAILAGIMRRGKKIDTEIAIFNKKYKWRTRISPVERHTVLLSQSLTHYQMF
jgi:hypothetical protein